MYNMTNIHLIVKRKIMWYINRLRRFYMSVGQPRRIPQQRRSRDRVEKILQAARRLIGERGNDSVSVGEIAKEAGVPKSSVYQYFPDKNAILWQLLLGYQVQLQSQLAKILDQVKSIDQLPAAIDKLVDVTARTYRNEKEFVAIAASVHGNTVLRELDADGTARIGEYLIDRFENLLPGVDREATRDALMFAVQVAGPLIQIAYFWKSKDARRLIREFKALLKLRLQSLIY